MDINEIKEGIIKKIKPLYDIKENVHQYYCNRNLLYYSAGSGRFTVSKDYEELFNKAIIELILECKIKEIKSDFIGTRMFVVGDKF